MTHWTNNDLRPSFGKPLGWLSSLSDSQLPDLRCHPHTSLDPLDLINTGGVFKAQVGKRPLGGGTRDHLTMGLGAPWRLCACLRVTLDTPRSMFALLNRAIGCLAAGEAPAHIDGELYECGGRGPPVPRQARQWSSKQGRRGRANGHQREQPDSSSQGGSSTDAQPCATLETRCC